MRSRAWATKHPRTGNVALLDGLLDPDIAITSTFGLDVADGREALLECAPRGDHGACSAVGCGELQQLHVVAAGRRQLSLQEDVGMAVDQARQHRRGAKVDQPRAGRCKGCEPAA